LRSIAAAAPTPIDDTPLRLVGAWHLACAAAGVSSVLPVLDAAVHHPAGWLTLGLLASSGVVGIGLLLGVRKLLGVATVMQGAQVLALSLPGVAAWIVRLGFQAYVSVPPLEGGGVLRFYRDTTVFTLWGATAQLPLGVSVNLFALVAFALCLSCRPDRAGERRFGSA
jgi:hypothetical protein